MAIAKFSDIIGDASGRIAGAVIARNVHATYLRPYRPAANPASSAQQSQRRRYSLISAAWSALSAIERAAYDTYAADPDNYVTNRLGDDVPLSGWQWFVRQSQNRLLCSLSTPTTPPASPPPTAPQINSLVVADNEPADPTATVTFPANTFLLNYGRIAGAFSPGQGALTKNSGFRLIRVLPLIPGGTAGFGGSLRACYGFPITNTLFHLRLSAISPEGLASPLSTASTIVT